MRLYDIVLWIHITAVIAAFGALFAHPVFLVVNARALLLAGVYLATDGELWSKAWVVVPLVLLFVIAGLGVTVLRRGEERLVATAEAGQEPAYAEALKTLRRWTGITLALIVVAIFFMAAKPFG